MTTIDESSAHATCVIVAIPENEDRTWKLSSEKVPHLTLMYLGEQEVGPKTARIAEFLEHVAKTSLTRFGLRVDRRGELGDDKADVLFFEKGWNSKELEAIRAYLLQNQEVYEAYHSTEQYPEWTPHLTLGYPETPARDDEKDHGIGWVSFDRVALWVGDYEGPEFRLKNYYDLEVAMSSEVADKGRRAAEYILSHKNTKETTENFSLTDEVKEKLDTIASKYGEKFFTTPILGYVKDLPESKQIKVMRSIISDIEQLKVLIARSMDNVAVQHGLGDMWNETKVVRDNLGQFTSKASGAAQEKIDSLSDFGDWVDKNIYGVNADGSPIDPNGQPLFEPVMDKLSDGGDWVDKNVYKVNPDGTSIKPSSETASVFSLIPSAVSHVYNYVTSKFKHDDVNMDVALSSISKQTLEETLAHFGVPGMKWGVRRSQAQLDASSDDAKQAAALATKVKKSGTGALSNKELDDLTKRLQFEQNYQRVIAQNQGKVRKGHRFTKEVLSVGSTANDAIKFVNSPAGRLTVLALGAAKTTGKHVKTVK